MEAIVDAKSFQMGFDAASADVMQGIKHDAERYKYVRQLSPNEFAKICKVNITTGEHFDTLIDRRIHGAGWR